MNPETDLMISEAPTPDHSTTTRFQRSFLRLFHDRNFSLLFAGQIISQIGDSMYTIALLWLLLEFTGSKSTMGFVTMISYLPMLVFGLFAGVLVDMFNRRRLMMLADILRALLVLILPVAYFTGNLSLAIILVVSFLVSSFSTLFNPARDALVPSLVDRGQLIKANSLIQSTTYAAILLGPAVGAALIDFVGLAHLFTLDALTFVASLAAIGSIKHPTGERAASEGSSLLQHFKEILRLVHSDKRLRFLLGLTAVNNFFIMGPAIIGTPIFIKEVLNEGAASYAIIEACLGLGMVAGVFIVNFLSRYLGKGKILLLGLVFDGVTYALVYWCNSLELLMLLIVLHAIGIPHIVIARTTLVQEWMPTALLGRVLSLVNMSVIGMTALTTGATGWLAEVIPINLLFGVFGTAGMLCGFVGWLYKPLRNA
jgi:MFS family permease